MSDARETAQKIASIVSPISRDISAALTENIFYAITAAVEAERARCAGLVKAARRHWDDDTYPEEDIFDQLEAGIIRPRGRRNQGAAAIDAAAGVIARGTK